MQIEKRRRSTSNLVQDHLAIPSYNPARLLDMLIEVMWVKNDNELAAELNLEKPQISNLRLRKMSLTPGILLRIHDVSGLTVENIRELAGIPQPKFD